MQLRWGAARLLAASSFPTRYCSIEENFWQGEFQGQMLCCSPVVVGVPRSPSVARKRPFVVSMGFSGTSRRVSFWAASSRTGPSSIAAMEAVGGRRFNRVSLAKARKALFEYLHSTRSIHYVDAEHISRNSPVFLHSLLSEFENEDDVERSVTRYLRYNPINEFEPFFESLGVDPSELQQFIPINLMYLADDNVLLDNYHVLCRYGVPRSKIGRIYKEGCEIFHYGSGVLRAKLRAYESLGLAKPTIIKLVTCCPGLLVGDLSTEFLRFHEKLKWLGVELDWLRGCFSDKSTYKWSQIYNMLEFFDRMGCDRKCLGRLIRDHPRIILDDSGMKVYVLVALLLKLGLKMDRVLFLFAQCPRILVGKFMRNFCRSVNFLACIGMATEEIAAVALSHPQGLGTCYCLRPHVVLKKLDVPADRLCEMINDDPSQFGKLVSRSSASVDFPKVADIFLREKTSFLLKLGFVENSDEMAKASSTFRGRGDQLQERFDCLVNSGLDYNTVIDMIKSYPHVLNQSAAVIKKKINYLLNDMGYSLDEVAKFPGYLCYNLEKIKTRCSMHRWILQNREHVSAGRCWKSHNSGAALSSILACSDARFVKYVVELHPQGPKQWERINTDCTSELILSR